MFDIGLNTQFCPKNVDRTCVFIFEPTARNILRNICSKIKTQVLPTYLGQKMFDIELNTQFCPKMSVERVFLFLNKWHVRYCGPFDQK